MTANELAALALETLDAQQTYFRSGRNSDRLRESIAKEKQLRATCESLLAAEQQPTLFDPHDDDRETVAPGDARLYRPPGAADR